LVPALHDPRDRPPDHDVVDLDRRKVRRPRRFRGNVAPPRRADPGLAGQAATFQVAAAKSVAADAATIATAAAHQAHGAMGMTQEYPLHILTRRLWAWTREYGTGTQSADELGAIVASAGAGALWPLIAGCCHAHPE
jgi:hypothetical protein